MPVLNGSHYIQKSNQDYWLKIGTPGRSDGVWTRMGNIRDDGSSGLVNVQPIMSVGFDMASAIERIRFLGQIDRDFGMNMGVLDLDRRRYIVAPLSEGLVQNVSLTRTRLLASIAIDLGLTEVASVITSTSELVSANPALGFDAAVTLLRRRLIAASMGFGFTQSDVTFTQRDVGVVSMAEGFSQSTSLSRTRLLVASPNMGYNMDAVVQRVRQLSSVSMALGVSEAVVLAFAGDHFIPLGISQYQPSAIGGTMTYNVGAAQANLADGNTNTFAADANGLTSGSSGTSVAYDFGSAVPIGKITALAAPDFSGIRGWSASAAMSIEYSDVSLTSGWTSAGQTITIVGGASPTLRSSAVFNTNNEVGSHRYWRIINKSGATGSNAWLAEVTMYTAKIYNVGYSMAVALTRGNAPQIPVAVNTSFTYNVGANEANLYDGISGTYAADPGGENTNTHASYDFGTAKTITSVRIVTANANGGWTNNMTLAIQYSDTSLTSGWTSTGVTITVPAGLNKTATSGAISSGAHRYWRVIYQSGTVVGANAWTDEIAFIGS